MLDWFKRKFKGEEEEKITHEEPIIKDNDDEKYIEQEEIVEVSHEEDFLEDSYKGEEYDKSFSEIIDKPEDLDKTLNTESVIVYDSENKTTKEPIEYREEEKFIEEISEPEVIKEPEIIDNTEIIENSIEKESDEALVGDLNETKSEIENAEKIASEIEKPSVEVIEPTIELAHEKSKDSVEEINKKSEQLIEESIEQQIDQPVVEPIQEPVEEIAEEPEEEGFFGKIFGGLKKTRDNITHTINDILGNYVQIDEELFEELEEVLITADIGAATTMKLIDNLRARIRKDGVQDPSKVMPLLADEARKLLENENAQSSYNPEVSPSVVLVVGVNGVGKTTTIGKLASKYKAEGKTVLLAAADTFRAAATEQLQEWAKRADVDIVYHGEGTDPGAVVFDAIDAAKSKNADIVLVDTAGRLHNKKNLMNELNKIYRIIEKNFPEANRETLIVLDATTGQNALSQAKEFNEVANISGIVLTKLDGTAKGGIAISLVDEYEIPVVYIGVGEQINDLQPFDAKTFANSIFGVE